MFVVDAGGADRVPVEASSDSEAAVGPRAHSKRYSHDSGLSDETYVERRHKAHRLFGDSCTYVPISIIYSHISYFDFKSYLIWKFTIVQA